MKPRDESLEAATGTSQLLLLLGIGLVHLCSLVLAHTGVHLHELGEVESGLLEHLDLTDIAVLEGEDRLALLLDFLSHGLGVRDPVM